MLATGKVMPFRSTLQFWCSTTFAHPGLLLPINRFNLSPAGSTPPFGLFKFYPVSLQLSNDGFLHTRCAAVAHVVNHCGCQLSHWGVVSCPQWLRKMVDRLVSWFFMIILCSFSLFTVSVLSPSSHEFHVANNCQRTSVQWLL